MSPSLFPAGQIVGGRYTVQALLAHRSWATTYSAIAVPNRELVLKIVAPEVSAQPGTAEAIRRMAAAASVLGERHVAGLLESERDAESGSCVLVTALSAHPSLAQLVQLCPLNVDEMIILLRNAARLLDTAHAGGVVHLALKPANVFVGPGPDYLVRLADFGAGALRSGVEPEERIAFAGEWLAPEQAAADDEERAGPPADIFTLALIAFFAATGRPLSRAGREDGAAQISACRRARELGVTLPPEADAVFARALSPAPADRFSTATDLVDALARACGQAAPAPEARTSTGSFAGGEPVTSAPAVAIPIAAPAPGADAAAPPSPSPPPSPAPAPPSPDPPSGSEPSSAAHLVAAATSPSPETAPPPPPGEEEDLVVPRAPKGRRFAVAAAILAASALAGAALVARARVAPVAPLHADAPGLTPAPASSPPEPAPPPQPLAARPPPEQPPSPGLAPSGTPSPGTPEPAPSADPATASLARLQVVCEPQCDRVLLNGKPMKSYPEAALVSPGTYGIGVARHDYGGQYQMLKLRPGQQETVRFTLNLLHPGAATKKPCGKLSKHCD